MIYIELLICRDIKKSFGDKDVLKGVNTEIKEGERVGLVGRNGAGKTTLANIIFGSVRPDEGSVIRCREGFKTGYLQQSTSYNVNTFNSMFAGDNTIVQSGEFMETIGQLGLKGVQEWSFERFNGLSGGEKTKLAIADIWVTRPDLLILDEPTNHMDFKGVEWLIEQLRIYRGTALIISHDRFFLDQVTGRIIELEDGTASSYPGNYTFYRDEKARRYKSQLNQYVAQRKYQSKIEAEIDRLKDWSAKAHREAGKGGGRSESRQMGLKEFERKKAKKMDTQIKSRIKCLEKIEIEGVKKPKEETGVAFNFEGIEKRGRRIVEARSTGKAFGERELFRDCSFYIQRGEKIGLIGPNGCGKTTLIKMLLGTETISTGDLWISPTVRAAYLSQDVMDMDDEKTTLEVINAIEGVNRTEARTLLANMGFDEAMLKKPIKFLSLGERTRIKLAVLILQENDLLILDEPTNHLDLHSREMLEETLADYNATLLVVSHDRYMLERLCDKLLVFDGGRIQRLEKGFGEYRKAAENKAGQNINEARMLVDNRIAFLVGELSRYAPGDLKYQELDEEFKTLSARKKELGKQ